MSFDFYSGQCVKDLWFRSLAVDDAAHSASIVLGPNDSKHDVGLRLDYVDVSRGHIFDESKIVRLDFVRDFHEVDRQNELLDGLMVGQLPSASGDVEQFGVVLDKGSVLTRCVSWAVDSLRAEGALDRLEERWLTDAGKVPVLT